MYLGNIKKIKDFIFIFLLNNHLFLLILFFIKTKPCESINIKVIIFALFTVA